MGLGFTHRGRGEASARGLYSDQARSEAPGAKGIYMLSVQR